MHNLICLFSIGIYIYNYTYLINSQKPVYTFFEALAICHTVQVNGIYNEDADREDEQNELLNVTQEIPPIFHKSVEDLINEEVPDVVYSPEINPEFQPFADVNVAPMNDATDNKTHKRPFSLSHIQLQRVISEDNRVSFSLLERKKKEWAHRRTQSDDQKHIPPPVALNQVEPVPIRDSSPSFRRRDNLQRSSTREYYNAPQFTEAQVIERQESMMQRNELETYIQILDYQASSPDEKALVEACARLGVIYLHDNNDIYTLKLRFRRKVLGNGNAALRDPRSDDEEVVQFKRLQVLEFTSDRKRMSVIVMDKNGQIWLYTKGAESHVLPLCKTRNSQLMEKTNNHIDIFAKEGLRTLAIARKRLTKTEFINFNQELIEANSTLQNRAAKVEACQKKIETGLELLGATAVEDALQDDVRDTLVSLRASGIKVWVLTGDKIETALNIALSCGHIPENATKYFIVGCQNEAQLNGHLEALSRSMCRESEQDFALLIDGASLAIALQHSPIKFRDVAYKCHAVLCCRLSPLQKSEVVHLVKSSPEKPVTAAIGDGANDVSMIQVGYK